MSKSADTDDLKTADLVSAGVRGELLESPLSDKRQEEKCGVISTLKISICFLSLQSLLAITAIAQSLSHNTELCTQTPPVYYECVHACVRACVHMCVCV